MFKVIDVSVHNGVIDWQKVKASGIDGVIIRAGYGRVITQKDKNFEKNYAGAVAAGLHVGAYWYSYADTPEDAEIEAKMFLQSIANKKFDLPLYFDIEEQKHVKLGRTVCTEMTKRFCSVLEKAGYFAGVYSFDSFFASNLDKSIQDKYTCWVARVENVKPTSCKVYDMHQYSWEGRINGLNGNVDMNDCFRDFPATIKSAGLNGYGKADKYTVNASKSGLTCGDAEVLASSLSKLGMSVVVVKN